LSNCSGRIELERESNKINDIQIFSHILSTTLNTQSYDYKGVSDRYKRNFFLIKGKYKGKLIFEDKDGSKKSKVTSDILRATHYQSMKIKI
jgi:hypothetical protein